MSTDVAPLRLERRPTDASHSSRRVMLRIGWTLVALQLLGLMWWSTRVERSASLTWDILTYYQAFWAIAHGHLNPLTAMTPGLIREFPFWQDNGEFLIWLLAPLYWLFPDHQLGFWWLQDFALTGITAVCFRWITELVPWRDERPWHENRFVALTWLVALWLLLLDPWTYWTATFAVHLEPFGALFAVLTLRALTQHRNSVWVWAALTLLSGAAETIYLISAGLAGVAWWLMHRRAARDNAAVPVGSAMDSPVRPLTVTAAGVAWEFALSLMHATRSVSSSWSVVHQDLAYLIGRGTGAGDTLIHTATRALTHPLAVVSVLGSHALNIWANVSPGGVIGLASVPGFFLSVPTLLENSVLKGQDFSYPGFSNMIVYPAMAVGSALVVATLLRRRRRLGVALACLVIANAAAWCAIWLPQTGTQFLRISEPAAAAIRLTAQEIPSSAEVIASQGFVGAFANRLDVHVFGGPQDRLQGPELFQIGARTVWFVLSANQGIEAPSTAATYQAIASVASLPDARLVRSVDGVWMFRWTPPAGTRSVAVGGPGLPIPGWVSAGAAGQAKLAGPARTWTLRSTGGQGYILSGDIWYLHPGRYLARVSLSVKSRTNVEVWNDRASGDQLLNRVVLSSAGAHRLSIPFRVSAADHSAAQAGQFPFSYTPVSPPAVAAVEVRIWTPGASAASVRSVRISQAPTGA